MQGTWTQTTSFKYENEATVLQNSRQAQGSN